MRRLMAFKELSIWNNIGEVAVRYAKKGLSVYQCAFSRHVTASPWHRIAAAL